MTKTILTSRAVQGGYEVNLPTLAGTEKQNRWADQIRDRFLSNLHNYDDYEAKTWETVQFGQAIQNMLLNYPISKFWIENMQSISRDDSYKKVMEFYRDTVVQDDDRKAKGLNSEVIAIKKEDDNLCRVTAKKEGRSKLINTARKYNTHKSFPGEYTLVMNHDAYVFGFEGNVGINIRWIGNYKENVWSPEASGEYKEAIGQQEALKEATKEDDTEIFHEAYDKILACVNADIPVYLVGPAGSGKNHTLEQVARTLKLDFYFTNSVQQEHKLTGFIDAGGRFHETEFYKAFTNGGLFFLDEMDASIPEVLVLLNAAIANGYFEFPNGRAEAHINFRVVAAGNTMGSGADDQYTGRLVLDQATLDRFAIIEFNYDLRVEIRLAKGDLELVQFVRDLREQSVRLGIRATYSYRCIMAATKLQAILSVEEILAIAIVKGIDRETVKTYQTTDDNRYSRSLKKLQRAV